MIQIIEHIFYFREETIRRVSSREKIKRRLYKALEGNEPGGLPAVQRARPRLVSFYKKKRFNIYSIYLNCYNRAIIIIACQRCYKIFSLLTFHKNLILTIFFIKLPFYTIFLNAISVNIFFFFQPYNFFHYFYIL